MREALRGIRFLLRRGGATVAGAVHPESLPGPAADLARSVMRDVEGIARSVDTAASAVAKRVLGGGDSPSDSLDEIVRHAAAETEFAQAIYVALDHVLRRLGVAAFFISEMSARTVFASWRRELRHGEPEDWAAELTLRLLAARVIRDAVADNPLRTDIRDVEAVALFAVLLWLQAERSEGENAAVLEAATDIALARAHEVGAAVRSGEKARIAALYRKYVDHV